MEPKKWHYGLIILFALGVVAIGAKQLELKHRISARLTEASSSGEVLGLHLDNGIAGKAQLKRNEDADQEKKKPELNALVAKMVPEGEEEE